LCHRDHRCGVIQSYLHRLCNWRAPYITHSQGSVRVLLGRPSKSMGNGKIWPSADAKPLNRSSPNLKTRDYVADTFFQKNFGLNPLRGFCLLYTRNIHPNSSMFTALFFSVLPKVYRRARWNDFHA